MYGAGGSVSEALKDRNQVQLKDKARNFKLYFLKNHIQLPFSLSLVTGELRTRAPAQAAKNEAEERGRLSEEYGYVEGGTTLALGHGEDNGHTADGDGGNDDGCDDHNDGNEANTDQVDTSIENVEDTSSKKIHRHQLQRLEKISDMHNDGNQNNQSEDMETYLAETSKASLRTSTN